MLIPGDKQLASSTLLSLLLQLLGEATQLTSAMFGQGPKLVEGDDVVDPFRIQQEVFQVLHLLLYPGRRTLVVLDAVLKLILLIPERRKFFLELGAITKEIDKLVVLRRAGPISPEN